MRMLFTQDYATSTAMVAAAALATMVMSVAEVGTSLRLVVVVAASVATMIIGKLVGHFVAARRSGTARWDPNLWDDEPA